MSLADRLHISATTLVVGFKVLGERILRLIRIGNFSRIQVSRFGARIHDYIGVSGFVLYPSVLVAGPSKHGCSRRTRLGGNF